MFQVTYIFALNYISITKCIVINSVHVFITTLTFALRGTKLLKAEWVALLVAFSGVVWFCNPSESLATSDTISADQETQDDKAELYGTLLAFATAVFYSLYNSLNSSGTVGIGGLYGSASTGVVLSLIASSS